MSRCIAIVLSVFALAGCVSVKNANGLVPPSGLVSDFTAPLLTPSEPVTCQNLKVGKGKCSYYVKDWLYTGLGADVCDMALKDAIADGGIKKLCFADYRQYSVLGFVTVFTVTAYGE